MPPFFDGLRPTLHIAHRGGAALAPENTLHAFAMAIQTYATDMLELDLHLSADGELVVSHDPSVDRCTDATGAIAEMTFSQLSELDAGFRFTRDGSSFPFRGRGIRIPRFTQLLKAWPGMRFNVDLKADVPGIEGVFASCVRREGASSRICCGSESDAMASRLHDALPEACHFYPRDALIAFVMAARLGEAIPDERRFTVLDMPCWFQGVRLVDRALLATAEQAAKWINAWTIDDAEEMRTLVRDGVGGIMTDRPDLLREVLRG